MVVDKIRQGNKYYLADLSQHESKENEETSKYKFKWLRSMTWLCTIHLDKITDKNK